MSIYIATLATLFDSSDEALTALENAGVATRDQNVTDLNSRVDINEARAAYVKAAGRCIEVARKLGMSRTAARRLLRSMSLPSMQRLPTTNVAVLIHEFVEKRQPWEVAVAASGLDRTKAESILRGCAGGLRMALRDMLTLELAQLRRTLRRRS
jgi:hypothetical protein